MIRKFVLLISIVAVWGMGTSSGGELELVRLKDLEGHTEPVRCVSFSPDSKYLVSGSADRTIKIWDTKTWHEIKTLKGHAEQVYCITFSPDGKYLASGSSDKTIKIWNTSNWSEITTIRLHAVSFALHPKAIAFSFDGRYFASVDGGYVRIWNTATWYEHTTLYMLRRDTRGRELSIDAVSFSGNGKYLAALCGALSSNAAIRIWDTQTWNVSKDISSVCGWCLSFSSAGEYFAFDDNCKVRVLNSDNWTEVVALNCWKGTTYLGFDPKNRFLLVTNGVKMCPLEFGLFDRVGFQLWDTERWKRIFEYQIDSWYRISGRRKLWDLRGIWDACISPDGRFIAGVPSRFLGEKTFKNYKKFIMIFLLNKVK